ncbi:hypothetical protein GCM10009116_15510 [Brevundimonas basaltis]|uniref:DUF2927 domain-containing protein n=1 Tax=Brevundimonas basaltis TaxID=472166 RepID=A0A7W8HY86_9CAUL|nr:hypothetical protein [Brevundimonas basaltis]MBB5291137.1 hypothetical protein [Brevundimonas basaltis]
MVALAIAALLAIAPAPPQPTGIQDPPPSSAAVDPGPVDLGEVEVTGRTLDSMIRSFVNGVAAPNRRRGLARWDGQVCVGVANLRGEPAQYIVDRVSTVAEDLGLRPGGPGCRPNVLVVASDRPSELAGELVQEQRQAFRRGGSGMDRGGSALRAFIASEAPVRWWQVSMPVDSETGQRATRIPGDCIDPCSSPLHYAPQISVFAASRLSTQIVDQMYSTVVILDMNKISGFSAQQLADYVAMVSLAQIDPEADTSGYASILNLFEAPGTTGLTTWDTAYLRGLYDAERTRRNLRAGRMEIADSIHDAHRDLRGDED